MWRPFKKKPTPAQKYDLARVDYWEARRRLEEVRVELEEMEERAEIHLKEMDLYKPDFLKDEETVGRFLGFNTDDHE